MIALLRRMERGDLGAMQRIRAAVKENRLTSRPLSEADCHQAIERDGRGWVIEDDGQVLGFGIANSVTGNIWALFAIRSTRVNLAAPIQIVDSGADRAGQKNDIVTSPSPHS